MNTQHTNGRNPEYAISSCKMSENFTIFKKVLKNSPKKQLLRVINKIRQNCTCFKKSPKMLNNRWQTPRWQCNNLMQATGRLIFKIRLSRLQSSKLLGNCLPGSWNTWEYKETYFRPSAILESVIGWNFVRTEVRLFPPDSLQWSLLVGRSKSSESQLEYTTMRWIKCAEANNCVLRNASRSFANFR